MRDAMVARGLDPRRIDPVIPTELVIDHSVRVDFAGTPDAYARNLRLELERNAERYGVVRWAIRISSRICVSCTTGGKRHRASGQYRALRPGRRAHHARRPRGGISRQPCRHGQPHTPMVNALGVFGWGVGGIEGGDRHVRPAGRIADAARRWLPFTGAPRLGVMCTDIVLALTRFLRAPPTCWLPWWNSAALRWIICRCRIARPSPTWRRNTARRWASFRSMRRRYAICVRPERRQGQIDLVERYTKAQGLWRDVQNPSFQARLPGIRSQCGRTVTGRPVAPGKLGAAEGCTAALPQRIRRAGGGGRRNTPGNCPPNAVAAWATLVIASDHRVLHQHRQPVPR